MWRDEREFKLLILSVHFHVMSCYVSAVAYHGEEDGEVVEVGEDLPDHRLQLHAEQSRVSTEQVAGRGRTVPFLKAAANLRIGVLERPVRSHVFDDVSQNGVDLTFLRGKGEI